MGKMAGVIGVAAMCVALGSATDRAAAQTLVRTATLKLDVAGPRRSHLHRKALYTFQVTNPGNAPVAGVTVYDVMPSGFQVVSAPGAYFDGATRTVSWPLGDLGPGQQRAVRLEVVAVAAGLHRHQVFAQSANGLRVSSEILTAVESAGTLLVEIVEPDGPAVVGSPGCYEVHITNTGGQPMSRIVLICTMPPEMQFKGAQGPTPGRERGSEVVFDPLPRLEAGAEVVYRVNVQRTGPGDMPFRARVSSSSAGGRP